jgi:hypothetical protein
MKRLHIILAFVMLVALSCEKQIPFNDPGTETKLVLNSYVTPGAAIQVHLSLSRHILDESNYQVVEGATVKLYENGSFVEDLVDMGGGVYEGLHIAEVSKSYRLTASASGYDQISADTSIPSPAGVANIEYEGLVNTPDGEVNRVTFDIVDPGGDNFYHLFLKDPDGDYNISFSSSSQFFETGQEDSYYYDGALFNDDLFNGNSVEVTLDFYLWGAEEAEVDIVLVSGSEEYYTYTRTIHAYSESQWDLFAQPVQIYSNVEGGHGAFTGFSLIREPFSL